MNEEEVLRSRRLRPPSENLDRRIEQLIRTPGEYRERPAARRISFWQCAAACLLCAAAAFVAGRVMSKHGADKGPEVERQYVFQVQPRSFNVFDWTQYPKEMAPDSIVRANARPVDPPRGT